MWIGVDDTDSPSGGCTTWVLSELLAEARALDVDLIGEPRLVRLNPNIPWKTRGNAALAARFGIGRGPRRRVGEVGGRAIWSRPRGRALPGGRIRAWVDAAWAVVDRAAAKGVPGTDPALVASPRRLPARLYWDAVRSVVPVDRVRAELARSGVEHRWRGSPQGLVGAAAAIAWAGSHPTWEMIAYRAPDRWGSPRSVDAPSVRRAAARLPTLFLCDDPRTRRLLVAPHTPCPILFGVRGTDPFAPLKARTMIRSERIDRWVLFRTNQGSGDHLVRRPIGEIPPFCSARVNGWVAAPPEVRIGGHVAFSVVDQDATQLRCVAFEPTKTLPRVARSLQPGDQVRVWGSRTNDPTLRLEGLEILRLAPRWTPPRPPRCPTCRRTTRSLGRIRGWRCASCRRRWPPEAARREIRPAEFGPGPYHPTPSARRHLAPRAPER